MVPVSSCSAEGQYARPEAKPSIRKAGQRRPGCLRVLYAQGLRSEASPKKCGSWNTKRESPSAPLGHRRAAADFFGASSVASALGIRPGRDPETDRRGARHQSPYPNQNCNRGLRSGCRGLGLHKRATRSLPKEDLGIPRQLVDRCSRANPAAAILDVPARGATPRRSISDYDKEEKPGAFGYFLT